MLLLGGIGLLFIGAAGAFNLFEKSPATDFVGEEVPRDMIEAAYTAGQANSDLEAEAQGFSPLVAPVDGEAVSLPTLATDDSSPGEEASAPTVSPQDVEQYKQDYQNQLLDPQEAGALPLWIYIEEIALEAQILPATSVTVEVEEDGEIHEFVQWEAPSVAAVGWHTNSARLGREGNTVLNGHHNAQGRVFRSLAYLQEGDYIQIYGDDGEWYTYAVANKMVLPEWNVTLEKRIENAAWTLPSEDERLTLITCWPEQSNSHRLIIVARPVHW